MFCFESIIADVIDHQMKRYGPRVCWEHMEERRGCSEDGKCGFRHPKLEYLNLQEELKFALLTLPL